jgi:hypothetical protein
MHNISRKREIPHRTGPFAPLIDLLMALYPLVVPPAPGRGAQYTLFDERLDTLGCPVGAENEPRVHKGVRVVGGEREMFVSLLWSARRFCLIQCLCLEIGRGIRLTLSSSSSIISLIHPYSGLTIMSPCRAHRIQQTPTAILRSA